MPTINVNNVELNYEEQGNGSVTIVFVHGSSSSARSWQKYYFPLLPEDYHAYAIDMRGHGKSNHVKHGCTLRQMEDDVLRFAQLLRLPKFVYVGVSMGGGVGIQLALDHTELLKGLVLLSSVSPFNPAVLPPEVMQRVISMVGNVEMTMALSRKYFMREPGERLQTVVDDAMLLSKETHAEWLDAANPDNQFRSVDGFRSLEIPTLVLFGDRDQVVPAAGQHKLADTIPGAKKVVFHDEGHLLVLESPERVFEEIRSFVDELNQDMDKARDWFLGTQVCSQRAGSRPRAMESYSGSWCALEAASHY